MSSGIFDLRFLPSYDTGLDVSVEEQLVEDLVDFGSRFGVFDRIETF